MMEFFANLHFIRPAWLLLLPVALGVWWLWRRRSAPLAGWREQMDPVLLAALVRGEDKHSRRTSYWLLAGWILGTIAIAGPTWRLEPNPFADDAQPLMILLKADQSMDLPAPAPSRIKRAQLKIADIAEARKGQPLGLIAYAGSAHLVLPPTQDTDIVAQMAAEISPEIMPVAGDQLDLALSEADRVLKGPQTGGSLLVISDSVELDAQQQHSGHFPIQFLALCSPDSPENNSVRAAARALRAPVQELTPDDADVDAIVRFSERRVAAGIAGEDDRWQEAGYWLTPILALMVALSFRRKVTTTSEDAP